MSWKERVTSYSKTIFPSLEKSKAKDINRKCECKNSLNYFRQSENFLKVLENEVKSNLPLQMAAYFNAVFIPVWIIVLLTFLVENYGTFSKLVQLIIITIIVTIFIVESMRLYMLYEGNLNDKIPELAGFWMLSAFLQFPLQGLLLFNPYFQLRVLEVVCQSVIFILLCLQIIFGFFALRFTASEQAKHYKFRKSAKKTLDIAIEH